MSPVPKSSAGSCRLTKGSTLYMFLKTKQIRKKNKIVTYKILKIFNLKQIKAPGLLQSSWRWERRGGGASVVVGVRSAVTNHVLKLHTVEKFVAIKVMQRLQLPAYSTSTSHSLSLSYFLHLSLSIMHFWAGDIVCFG